MVEHKYVCKIQTGKIYTQPIHRILTD